MYVDHLVKHKINFGGRRDIGRLKKVFSSSSLLGSSSWLKSVNFFMLRQVCENQTCCNLIFADLLQVVETICIKLVDKNLDNQLASSLLTTCSGLVIIKPEQAM